MFSNTGASRLTNTYSKYTTALEIYLFAACVIFVACGQRVRPMEFPLAWGHWRRPTNFSADLLMWRRILRRVLVEPNFEKNIGGAEFWEEYRWIRILRRVFVEPNLEKSIGGAEFWEEYWWIRILRKVLVEPNFEKSIVGAEFWVWEEYWWNFPSCFRNKIQVTKQTLSYVDSDMKRYSNHVRIGRSH